MSANIAPVNWRLVALATDQVAAEFLDAHAKALDGMSKRLFMERGLVMLEMEERSLWQKLTDADTGQPYHSFERWACAAFDYSRRDCFYAKAAAKELRDVPREKLLTMTRANIEVLKKIPQSIRKEPQVIQAAQTMKEDAFAKAMDAGYPELHLADTDKSVVDEAIEMCKALEDLSTRDQVIMCWAVAYMEENRERYEDSKAQETTTAR